MLYFSFLTLNWLLINILIMIILAGLVITVKVWQHFRRWGDSRALNLEYIKKNIDIRSIKFEYYEILKKNVHKPVDTIVIFSPFLLSIQNNFYLATAFAEKNYRVIVFQSRSFLENLSKIITNDGNNRVEIIRSILSEITTHFGAKTFIGFDLIVSLLFYSSNCRGIGIRPILNKKELNIFSKFPFTYRWFFLLRLKIQNGLEYFNQFSFEIDKNSIAQNDSDGDNVFLIYPEKNLLSNTKIKHFLNNINVQWEFINGGGFSFKEQETIVFSLILKKFSE